MRANKNMHTREPAFKGLGLVSPGVLGGLVVLDSESSRDCIFSEDEKPRNMIFEHTPLCPEDGHLTNTLDIKP